MNRSHKGLREIGLIKWQQLLEQSEDITFAAQKKVSRKKRFFWIDH